MEELEEVMLAVCAAVGQSVALLAEDDEPRPIDSKTPILTVSVLDFDPMLLSAAYSSWFDDNLRCTKETSLITR
ncbi:uncharacterized protein PITG_17833 [Phytophthora infestans T30-4]|uniref:Uncharacterized protein n=2 Tax=Phytophthora infestans TaxID=4787 RepID=D0NW64_PHYIT|nr:uncharacterized protein PITG_17833 [Phytophthora infestans T30-4]EEY66949.1 hypothetical protein PITG_17833 [Phytophthora infestans T30-4]|eukprot:XP_002896667.1 hypothetical protein PITG_17833 [Phytophthora infestans T30-4]